MKSFPSCLSFLKVSLAAVALLFLLARSAPATAEPLQLTVDEQAWLRAHPVVRLGVDPNYPPFEFYENSAYQGMAYDYLYLLASRLGLRVEPVSGISWGDALEKLKSRSGVDLVALITRDRTRESFVEFTRDYISFPAVLFTRKDSRFISGIREAAGQRPG